MTEFIRQNLEVRATRSAASVDRTVQITSVVAHRGRLQISEEDLERSSRRTDLVRDVARSILYRVYYTIYDDIRNRVIELERNVLPCITQRSTDHICEAFQAIIRSMEPSDDEINQVAQAIETQLGRPDPGVRGTDNGRWRSAWTAQFEAQLNRALAAQAGPELWARERAEARARGYTGEWQRLMQEEAQRVAMQAETQAEADLRRFTQQGRELIEAWSQAELPESQAPEDVGPGRLDPEEDTGDNVIDDSPIAEARRFVTQFLAEVGSDEQPGWEDRYSGQEIPREQ